MVLGRPSAVARIVYRTVKGIVFREFAELVASRHGEAVWDAMVQEVAVPSAGAYTTVGTYPFEELAALLRALSRHTGVGQAELLQSFGEHLFGALARRYPFAVAGHADLFPFLMSIDGVVHVEVRKLYPEAELPTFHVRVSDGVLTMEYRSARPLAALAQGLLRGAIAHWGGGFTLRRTDVGACDGTAADFELSRA